MIEKKPVQKKKPIPLIVSGIAYVNASGFIRYCTSGHDSDSKQIPLPKDFKEWVKR